MKKYLIIKDDEVEKAMQVIERVLINAETKIYQRDSVHQIKEIQQFKEKYRDLSLRRNLNTFLSV